MANVQIAIIDQENTQIALSAPSETQVNIAVPGVQGPAGDVAVAQDGTAATPGIRFENDTNTGIYRPGADQLAISTGGTGRVFINSTGSLGVGASLTYSSSYPNAAVFNNQGVFFADGSLNYFRTGFRNTV